MANDEAHDLVMACATGHVEDVAQIAQLLAAGSESTWCDEEALRNLT